MPCQHIPDIVTTFDRWYGHVNRPGRPSLAEWNTALAHFDCEDIVRGLDILLAQGRPGPPTPEEFARLCCHA